MIFAIVFVLLVLMELAYFFFAKRYNIIDKPNSRSSHTTVTLRGGGIIFLFAVWLFYFFFGGLYPWFVVAVTLVGLISFADDIKSLPDSIRLVVQFVAMGLMFYQFGILNFHDWWMVIVALIVCVGITNAYNFMDGINGITGAYSLAVLAPLAWIDQEKNFISLPFIGIVALSILIFLFFNFRKKAVCFAGDVGSISMAFIVVFFLGKLIIVTGDFSYIVFLVVYGVDTVLTIIHRIQLHEHLGQAHRKHAFQLMANELHLSHTSVSLLYMVMQLVVSFGLILLPINHYLYLAIAIIVLSAAYMIFMKKYYHLHEEYLNSLNKIKLS